MMNEEEYDSDTSDEDYIPEGGVVESEDDGSCDDQPEDNDESDNEDHSKKKKKKKKPGKLKKENSKKNPLLASAEVDEESEQKDNVEETKKEEDLWADFLADVDEKPAEKPKAKSINSWASLLDPKKTVSSSDSSSATESKPQTTQTSTPTTEAAKVKITKVFEFAGEEVRVEEEVDANSIEAKKSLMEESKKGSEINKSAGTKRPLGLSSIVGILDSKKKKLSTLEKTKIDWLNYKTSEGIEEEMQGHLKSKDGYLEKKEFLERADLRQFEIERNMRLNRRSNR